ncbi:hypothetical protein DICPUDRAFT_156864 [Dictyostelium purpureum]|uniref:BAR domain-containing protein n=1 Tax=Dictyostelium purpureum TaxID=5786 RepID=F0ZXM7_DICPU|nr:uncharacterized protein DICPUDRAFT_156864 [Dictyostelium purpureum]EGC31292.1 hypothetical protein DICPUDRAFT_156864 [Dictyostelium purpureum]|eukprot:XP_003292169.1 hypothetical protein DICPUDRAFT_156864 [Dictyostelium purpureum]
MFKNLVNKTKSAVQEATMEMEKEPDHVENAKAQLKNMKWSIKLLIQLARGYYLSSDKQVQQGTAFSQILARFSEKISHTNFIINQTLPLSDSLREVGEGIKSSSIYFQQYTQQFSDRFAIQIETLYKEHVKKVADLCKQQDEVRLKYNSANHHLKSAQKSNQTGTKLAERTTEYENTKAHYDQISANLCVATQDMVQYVQKEVALLMKSFVAEQQLLVDECIKMWINAEAKLFNSQSPTTEGFQTTHNPVNLSKLSLDEQIVSPPPPQQSYEQISSPPSDYSSSHSDFSSQHQQYQQEYQPPQQQQQEQTSPNPFDDRNPFDN